jgi:hypothetical protein
MKIVYQTPLDQTAYGWVGFVLENVFQFGACKPRFHVVTSGISGYATARSVVRSVKRTFPASWSDHVDVWLFKLNDPKLEDFLLGVAESGQ